MSVEKFNKKLPNTILEAGFNKPTPLQLQLLPLINSGKSLYAIAPVGSGKSTNINITVIKRLKSAFEKAPRALIIVPDMERAIELEKQFIEFSKDTNLRWDCIYDTVKIEDQLDELFYGSDVVIATPKRLQEIYFRAGINVNKLQLFILDDAELLMSQGHKVIIERLCDSLPPYQKLIFAQKLDQRFVDATAEVMPFAEIIEFKEDSEATSI